MTDEDGDGTYSFFMDLPIQTNMWFTIFTSNYFDFSSWANAASYVLRPSNASPWINNDTHEIIMKEPGDEGYNGDNGSINYPVIGSGSNYNTARAIRIDYTPSTRTLDVTRYIAVASSYNSWSTSTDYLEETSCGSKIYTGNVKLAAGTGTNDGFKFIYIDNGSQNYGGKNDDGYISNSGSNYQLSLDGEYYLYAQFNDWKWTDPELVKVKISAGTYGMATFSLDQALDFTGITDIQAYTITAANKSTGELTKSEVTGKVPASTGLYIEGTSAYVPVTDYTGSVTNMLVVATSKIDNLPQESSTNTNFILTVNKDGSDVTTPKFFKVNANGNTVLANKAYLQIPTADAARESFWFEEATSIEALAQEKSLDGQTYNFAGQRVAQPTKGLYIVNGKKIIKK